MHHLKKFLKVLFIVAIICFLVFAIYRYQKLKEEGKLSQVISSSNNEKNGINSEEQLIVKAGNQKGSEKEQKEAISEKDKINGYVVEDKNYDDYYNQFNFDNTLLLYEGKQHPKGTKEAFDILIKDADDPLYSKPIVVFKNFNLSTNQITVQDIEQYKNVLNAAKSQVGNSYCTFEFGYNALRTVVNKIIITKN